MWRDQVTPADYNTLSSQPWTLIHLSNLHYCQWIPCVRSIKSSHQPFKYLDVATQVSPRSILKNLHLWSYQLTPCSSKSNSLNFRLRSYQGYLALTKTLKATVKFLRCCNSCSIIHLWPGKDISFNTTCSLHSSSFATLTSKGLKHQRSTFSEEIFLSSESITIQKYLATFSIVLLSNYLRPPI